MKILIYQIRKLQHCPRRFQFFLHISQMEPHAVTAVTISLNQNLG